MRWRHVTHTHKHISNHMTHMRRKEVCGKTESEWRKEKGECTDEDNNTLSDQSLWIPVPSFQFITQTHTHTQRVLSQPIRGHQTVTFRSIDSLTIPQQCSENYSSLVVHGMQGETKGVGAVQWCNGNDTKCLDRATYLLAFVIGILQTLTCEQNFNKCDYESVWWWSDT